jgi:hypothetical protein
LTRYGVRPAPLAIEFEQPRNRSAARDILDVAARAGGVELVCDGRGVTIARVRIGAPPPPSALEHPVHQLLALARRRRSARVWIGGIALPAALPRAVWDALLSPLAASHAPADARPTRAP